MEVTHNRIDLVECESRGQAPAAIISRAPDEHWLVSTDAIRMDRPIVWSPTQRESYVHIPLVPYLLRPEADLALAFMLQIGMRVSFSLERPIRRLHIVTGHAGPPTGLREIIDPELGTLWQYFAGFGIILE